MLYVVIYKNGGFSDGLTIEEVQMDINRNAYGGVVKYYPMPEFSAKEELK